MPGTAEKDCPAAEKLNAYLVDFTRYRNLTTQADFRLRMWRLDRIACSCTYNKILTRYGEAA